MSLREVTDASFDAEVLKAEGYVLVDFWAPGCGPCRQLLPNLETVATTYADTVKIVKCDVTQASNAAMQYSIFAVPALRLFKDGQLLEERDGALSVEELTQWISSAVSS